MKKAVYTITYNAVFMYDTAVQHSTLRDCTNSSPKVMLITC